MELDGHKAKEEELREKGRGKANDKKERYSPLSSQSHKPLSHNGMKRNKEERLADLEKLMADFSS